MPILVNHVFSSGTRSHHQVASGQVFDQTFSTLLESIKTPFSSTMCDKCVINFFCLLRKKYFSEVNFKFWLHILRQSLYQVQILRDHQSSRANSIVLVPKIAGHHQHKVPRAVATVLWHLSSTCLSHVDVLMSFNGTHCSPHNVAPSLATKTPLGAEWGDVGSVVAGLHGETPPFLGSFPQMSYSGSRQMMLSYI